MREREREKKRKKKLRRKISSTDLGDQEEKRVEKGRKRDEASKPGPTDAAFRKTKINYDQPIPHEKEETL